MLSTFSSFHSCLIYSEVLKTFLFSAGAAISDAIDSLAAAQSSIMNSNDQSVLTFAEVCMVDERQ